MTQQVDLPERTAFERWVRSEGLAIVQQQTFVEELEKRGLKPKMQGWKAAAN